MIIEILKRYFSGPLATLLLVGLSDIGRNYGLSPTVVLPFAGLGLSTYFGGWRSNLVCSLIVSTYAIFVYPHDLSRILQVALASIALAIGASLLKQQERRAQGAALLNLEKAEFVNSINGNLRLLGRAHKMTDDLLSGWSVLSPTAQRLKVEEIRGTLADLQLLTGGWHAMAKERGLVEKESDNDAG